MTQLYRRKPVIVMVEEAPVGGTMTTEQGQVRTRAGDRVVVEQGRARVYSQDEFNAQFEFVPADDPTLPALVDRLLAAPDSPLPMQPVSLDVQGPRGGRQAESTEPSPKTDDEIPEETKAQRTKRLKRERDKRSRDKQRGGAKKSNAKSGAKREQKVSARPRETTSASLEHAEQQGAPRAEQVPAERARSADPIRPEDKEPTGQRPPGGER